MIWAWPWRSTLTMAATMWFWPRVFSPLQTFGGVSLTCNGGKDMALVKLSAATGGTIWAKKWGSSADETPKRSGR